MAHEKTLDCTQYMGRGRERSNIADGVNELSAIDPYTAEKERNSNTKRNLRLKGGLDKIVAGALLSAAMVFSPLTGISKAVAAAAQPQPSQQQQYEPCDTQNPNYCTECRDESRRDFAKCGEIDLTLKDSLYASKRVYLNKSTIFPNYQGIDYDPYTKKAVYSANISKTGMKLELFIVDADIEGNKLIINDLNKKRITYDSITNKILNVDPFWTRDRKQVMYYLYDDKIGEKVGYLINIDGTNKRRLTPKECINIYSESHDKKTGRVNVAPAN